MLAMMMTKGTRLSSLDMLAILVLLGTRYACHFDEKEDQTCLPFQFC